MASARTSPVSKDERFMEMLASHRQLIIKVCYMYANETATFDDLYQEVMINLWQGLDKWRGECKMSTWIYRLAFNTCVSYHRSTRRHNGGLQLDAIPEIAADDSTRTADLKNMYRLISKLNPLDKAIIMLWLYEKPYDEIASITGLSKANIASRLYRIKNHLIEMGNS